MTVGIEAALARHRALSILLLAVLAGISWAWLLSGAGMDMAPAGAPMGGGMAMPMTEAAEWSASRIGLVLAMWWVMMAAMMLPAAAPTILLYVTASARAGTARPPSEAFLAGYLGIWGGFSALATAAHVALDLSAALSPMAMASTSRWISVAVLVAAGLYQLSPLKDACLRQCRNPAQFISRHYRPGPLGAARMGTIHGAYCVGCCWLLMALLFVGGVMNPEWIAVLTVLVAAEKLLTWGRAVAFAGGVACLVGAAWVAVA